MNHSISSSPKSRRIFVVFIAFLLIARIYIFLARSPLFSTEVSLSSKQCPTCLIPFVDPTGSSFPTNTARLVQNNKHALFVRAKPKLMKLRIHKISVAVKLVHHPTGYEVQAQPLSPVMTMCRTHPGPGRQKKTEPLVEGEEQTFEITLTGIRFHICSGPDFKKYALMVETKVAVSPKGEFDSDHSEIRVSRPFVIGSKAHRSTKDKGMGQDSSGSAYGDGTASESFSSPFSHPSQTLPSPLQSFTSLSIPSSPSNATNTNTAIPIPVVAAPSPSPPPPPQPVPLSPANLLSQQHTLSVPPTRPRSQSEIDPKDVLIFMLTQQVQGKDQAISELQQQNLMLRQQLSMAQFNLNLNTAAAAAAVNPQHQQFRRTSSWSSTRGNSAASASSLARRPSFAALPPRTISQSSPLAGNSSGNGSSGRTNFDFFVTSTDLSGHQSQQLPTANGRPDPALTLTLPNYSGTPPHQHQQSHRPMLTLSLSAFEVESEGEDEEDDSDPEIITTAEQPDSAGARVVSPLNGHHNVQQTSSPARGTRSPVDHQMAAQEGDSPPVEPKEKKTRF